MRLSGRYCHGTSDTGILIHKSYTWRVAVALNARLTAPSALWACFIAFDLPSFAGSASFTQRPHSMDMQDDEEEPDLQIDLRMKIGNRMIKERIRR